MNLKLIKKLCLLEKPKLDKLLTKYLFSKGYRQIRHTDSYIMAEGDLPICLIAHMDTVFKYVPDEFFYDAQKKVLWAPHGAGFDDRAGIYCILQILENGFKPSIIFTDKEESGGIGARKLVTDFPECPFIDCRALIELDRAYKNDAVFYECDNEHFEKYIEKFGFKLEWGTFTDISIIAPAWKIAAVNLSVGYEDEHTGSERLHCGWCDDTIKKVKKILINSPNMLSYAYIPYIPGAYAKKRMGYYNNNRCLICNTPIASPAEMTQVADPGSSIVYPVCNSCYWQYYVDLDDNEQKKAEALYPTE